MSEANRVITMDERERKFTRGRGVCFTVVPWWAPNVLTKIRNCDMSGWTQLCGVPNFTHQLGKVPLTGGGTYKTKDFNT